ncbi:MAG TPA: hypothetical protein VIX81_09195 [Gammaproteobacteria bacterium]
MNTTTIHGGCHCGNLRFEFTTMRSPSALLVRACRCSFCHKHNARYSVDPHGRLEVRVRDPGELSRYRFAGATADFLVCRQCGVLCAVTSEIDGHLYGALNLATADNVDDRVLPFEYVDHDDESDAEQLAQRQRVWIREVVVELGAD